MVFNGTGVSQIVKFYINSNRGCRGGGSLSLCFIVGVQKTRRLPMTQRQRGGLGTVSFSILQRKLVLLAAHLAIFIVLYFAGENLSCWWLIFQLL